MKNYENSIKVWVDGANIESVSALPSPPNILLHAANVSGETLTNNLKAFIENFRTVFDDINPDNSPYTIETIELNLAVNAQGGIELIGKLSAGVTTSIKVNLVRRKG